MTGGSTMLVRSETSKDLEADFCRDKTSFPSKVLYRDTLT